MVDISIIVNPVSFGDKSVSFAIASTSGPPGKESISTFDLIAASIALSAIVTPWLESLFNGAEDKSKAITG